MTKEKWLKIARRFWVEKHEAAARHSPQDAANAMSELGYYSENTKPSARVEHVKDILRRIKEQGHRLSHKTQEQVDSIRPFQCERERSKRDHKFELAMLTKEQLHPNNGKPWDPRDLDRVLNQYLAGKKCGAIDLDLKLGRDGEAIHRQVCFLWRNEDGKVLEKYEPTGERKWRGSVPLTSNEKRIIRYHRRKGVRTSLTAVLLQRPIDSLKRLTDAEIAKKKPPDEDKPQYSKLPSKSGSAVRFYLDKFFSETDILLAHRYLFYCSRRPILSNKEYNDAKRECIEYGGGSKILLQPASDKPIQYPEHIRYLAGYMLFKHESQKPKPWDTSCLPSGFWQEYEMKT